MTHVPTSNILAAALALYASAIVWGLLMGPGTFLAGLLGGAGSIALGVWLGVILTRPPPPPDPIEEDW